VTHEFASSNRDVYAAGVSAVNDPPGWTRPRRTPDPRIRPLLARDHVGFAETGGVGESWIETPTAAVTVILNVGAPFGGLPEAFVAGLSDTFAVVEGARAMTCLDLKLTPLGAYSLLGLPMHEVAGRAVDARDLLGPDLARLLDQLREASRWERRFEVVDAFLLRRLAAGPRPSPAVEWTWRRLVETGGRLPVARLAAEVDWSGRHLVAMYRQQLGLPPKVLGRVIRFNRLLRRLDEEGEVRWADLAVDCGYYDQAHLYRDFRQFAGATPSGFLAARRAG
jgi:AraC-like DNA-binding protein